MHGHMSDGVILNTIRPLRCKLQSGDWFYMSVPLDLFGCSMYPGLAALDCLDFYNQDIQDAEFM